jgi:hypothetical protein
LEKSEYSKFYRWRKNLSLELVREPKNQYDPNAIKIIGIVHGWFFKHRYHIGYISADIAKKLVVGKFWPEVEANLRMVQAREYINVKFDLLGPHGRKKEYRMLDI